MSVYSSYPMPRRPSPLPLILAGAAFALALWMVLERTGLLQPTPLADPRPVTPRGEMMGLEQTVTQVFAQNAPSVAHITTEKLARTWLGQIARYPEGTGTGFLWDENGTVVTNYHVVQTVVEARSQLKVALGDELYDGTVLGTSPQHDIAVVRMVGAPRGLRPIPIGTSADLKVGQFVLAIGNPFGLDQTLTTGVISALNRTIRTSNSPLSGLIQIDAAINPGNSGGPLLDSAGRLIGMNTAIYSPSGASAGIGFAVPVDLINEVVPQLLDGTAGRRFLGIVPGDPIRLWRSTGYSIGIPVMSIEPNAGAARAGMRAFRVTADGGVLEWGDLIVAVDGTPVRTVAELLRTLQGRRRGETVPVTVLRGNSDRLAEVVLQVPLT